MRARFVGLAPWGEYPSTLEPYLCPFGLHEDGARQSNPETLAVVPTWLARTALEQMGYANLLP